MNKKVLMATALMFMSIGAAKAQKADFSYFKYTGNDSRFDKKIDRNNQYLNPIMAGFYPDPSICRKGDTYYLVNSSFSFFPGVPISTSKDLVNWKQMGFVLDRQSQLPLGRQKVSGGIFAPAITYNKKNKTFYMITTNVGMGNFFVKTKDPAKGWSEPIILPHVVGIDPSFCFDDNGKAYIVNNDEPVGGHDWVGERSIVCHEFSVKGDSTVGPSREILRGGTHLENHPIWIEGPHMFKYNGFYYLMCAEGGTGSWHSEVILRSKNPFGPFESYSGNPILTQRQGLDPNRPDFVSSAGHADIVQTPNGQWWAVFLGCRPYEEDFYNTGRDTYLLPVTWKNGWPVILESGKAIPTVNNKKGLQPTENYNTGNFSYEDNFGTDNLNIRWIFLRNPKNKFYSLGSDGLTIDPQPVNISQSESPSAIFCRQQHTTFTAETELTYMPSSSKDLAGLALLQNEQYNFVFGKTKKGNDVMITLQRSEKTNVTVASVKLSAEDAQKPLKLKVSGNGRYYDFFYAVGNGPWQTLALGTDAINLSTGRSGGFIGACIGLYATSANE
ncbi:glycoside hydrolase family 43 protein [Xylanibacter oryzae]|uniref:glycoside hydrolase family 43 protein n=1 Tax=Xylanibacter oryzae TaxID=185293 RepID=UPI000562965D|nr:glycoside hydrolase family 43 protein [Xylanibacter oryzae]